MRELRRDKTENLRRGTRGKGEREGEIEREGEREREGGGGKERGKRAKERVLWRQG